jgi:hypothetical protein
MRSIVAFLGLILLSPATAQDKPPADVDRQLIDVLKTIHNRGADMYNAGDPESCLAFFQGALQTTRAVLAHRPAEQKFIDDQLAAAARLAPSDQAFALHNTIAALRDRLRGTGVKQFKNAEMILPPPRELPPEPKVEEIKPMPLPKIGVNGRLMWQAKPLAGVELTFVEREAKEPRMFRIAANAEGRYVLETIPPGKYTVLLTAPKDQKTPLPERYAAAATSPLVVDIKGDGEALDFMLQ